MVRTLPMTKARINLGAIVKQVRTNKDYIVLEKDGIPVAALMDIDEFEDYLELRDPEVKKHIEKSRKEYEAGKHRSADKLLAKLEQEEKRARKK